MCLDVWSSRATLLAEVLIARGWHPQKAYTYALGWQRKMMSQEWAAEQRRNRLAARDEPERTAKPASSQAGVSVRR